MKTWNEVMEAIRSKTLTCHSFDGREFSRLASYAADDELAILGYELKEGVQTRNIKTWDFATVVQDAREDLDFAFEKARAERGLSASSMYWVMKMWNWVLNDSPIPSKDDDDDYNPYGLPFLESFKFPVPSAS